MYSLSIESDAADVVIKTSDAQKVDALLTSNGISTLDNDELAHL